MSTYLWSILKRRVNICFTGSFRLIIYFYNLETKSNLLESWLFYLSFFILLFFCRVEFDENQGSFHLFLREIIPWISVVFHHKVACHLKKLFNKIGVFVVIFFISFVSNNSHKNQCKISEYRVNLFQRLITLSPRLNDIMKTPKRRIELIK